MTMQKIPANPVPPDPLLDIHGLSVCFDTSHGSGRAVQSLDLHLSAGETLGLVGESGCGKSATALAILDLIPSPPGRIESGKILFRGRDLRRADAPTLRRIRGRQIGMIFQEPMTALNPVLTIGRQLAEPLVTHRGLSRSAALDQAADWLARVRIPSPHSRLAAYPHQLSGGMRQRVMIAMAMICHPRIVIADEPTTALDVTTQRQILELMDELRTELDVALLLITHDLGVVARMAHRVMVMYAGQVVETAPANTLFASPQHPYTQGLLQALPRLGAGKKRLSEIPGSVPSLTRPLPGCTFAPRCPVVFDRCRHQSPPLISIGPLQSARCWRCDH